MYIYIYYIHVPWYCRTVVPNNISGSPDSSNGWSLGARSNALGDPIQDEHPFCSLSAFAMISKLDIAEPHRVWSIMAKRVSL